MPLTPVLKVAELIEFYIYIFYKRLGHVNYKTLKEMINNKTVDDLNVNNVNTDEKFKFCEGCAYEQQYKKSFPRDQARTATKPGEVFYVDLCRKMSLPSINGGKGKVSDCNLLGGYQLLH